MIYHHLMISATGMLGLQEVAGPLRLPELKVIHQAIIWVQPVEGFGKLQIMAEAGGMYQMDISRTGLLDQSVYFRIIPR